MRTWIFPTQFLQVPTISANSQHFNIDFQRFLKICRKIRGFVCNDRQYVCGGLVTCLQVGVCFPNSFNSDSVYFTCIFRAGVLIWSCGTNKAKMTRRSYIPNSTVHGCGENPLLPETRTLTQCAKHLQDYWYINCCSSFFERDKYPRHFITTVLLKAIRCSHLLF